MKRLLYMVVLILFSIISLSSCRKKEMRIELSKGRRVSSVSFKLNDEVIFIDKNMNSYDVLKDIMLKICHSDNQAHFYLKNGAYRLETKKLHSISETNRYEDGEIIKSYQFKKVENETINNYRKAFDNKFFVISNKSIEKIENKKKFKEEGHFNYFNETESINMDDADYDINGGQYQKRHIFYYDYENISMPEYKKKSKEVCYSKNYKNPIPTSILNKYFPILEMIGFTIKDEYIQAYPDFYEFSHELTDKYIILTYKERFYSNDGLFSPENYNDLYEQYIGSYTEYTIYFDYQNIIKDEYGDYLYCSALDFHQYIIKNENTSYSTPQTIYGLPHKIKEITEERRITTYLDLSKEYIEGLKNSFVNSF